MGNKTQAETCIVAAMISSSLEEAGLGAYMGEIADEFGGKKTGQEVHITFVTVGFGETEDRHTWVCAHSILILEKVLYGERGWMSKEIYITVLAFEEVTCSTDICM